MAVFLDCSNGEILAITHYDPDEKNPSKPVKLRAVSDQFEPGSILKAFTAVGVIEEGLINYDDSIYCEEGKWKVGRRTIHDDKELGWLNFRQVMELSSNIGIGKYAIMHGGEELVEVLRRFGLGEKTRVGLPGETPGVLRPPAVMSDFNIASMAMGHSIAVNAVQMANGFAAIANGGELFQPRLILGQVDHEGQLICRSEPTVLRRALNRMCADTLASILRGVVERGTAEPVNSTVVSIAGKTGTAQLPNLEKGGYYWGRYMASFAGFFPYEKPKVAGIVLIENPQPIHYGGWTAGPVFRRVAERYSILHPDVFTAPHRMLSETSTRFQNTCEIPDLVGHRVQQAVAMAAERGLTLRCDKEEGTVVWQFPPADRLAFEGDEILVSAASPSDEEFAMADLRGLSIREASAFLAKLGIELMVRGNGQVVKQSIMPGQRVARGERCRLDCRPSSGGSYKAQRADKASKAGNDKRES
jgi:membrane peptidoglycan carboxypeptidase